MSRKASKMPWIDWREGVAYVHWYDPDTRKVKRLSLRTTDAAEAQARYAAFLVEGEAITKPRGGGLTVAQALDDYLKEHVNGKCAAPWRQEIAARNLRAHFGDKVLHEVDIPASRSYADARRAGRIGGDRFGHRRTGSEATIRRELNTLIAAANHARRWKRLTADKMPTIELTADTSLGHDDEAPYLTKKEVAALIDRAEGELRHFIELAYWTGARRASISELEWRQVKWEQKIILLQKPEKRATKKRQPIVPILPEMEPALHRIRDATEGQGRLFSNISFYNRFKDLAEQLGFAGRSHPHILRHSRATHLLQDGVSIYAVARLLGDTVQTVERVYGHHSAEVLAEQLSQKVA
jgi:integrase